MEIKKTSSAAMSECFALRRQEAHKLSSRKSSSSCDNPRIPPSCSDLKTSPFCSTQIRFLLMTRSAIAVLKHVFQVDLEALIKDFKF
jgi:hypothetical protein